MKALLAQAAVCHAAALSLAVLVSTAVAPLPAVVVLLAVAVITVLLQAVIRASGCAARVPPVMGRCQTIQQMFVNFLEKPP